MKIDKNNYEEYIIDALDGTLSTELYEALMEYLSSDEEAMREYRLLTHMPLSIPPEQVNCDQLKERLRQQIAESHSRRLPRVFRRYIAVASITAAAALLIVGLFLKSHAEKDMETIISGLSAVDLLPADTITQETEQLQPDAVAVESSVQPVPEPSEKTELIAAVAVRPSVAPTTGSLKREIVTLPDLPEQRIDLTVMEDIRVPGNDRLFREETLLKADIDVEVDEIIEQQKPSLGRALRSFFAPVTDVLPISFIEDNEKKGVVIASIIKIEKQKPE